MDGSILEAYQNAQAYKAADLALGQHLLGNARAHHEEATEAIDPLEDYEEEEGDVSTE